MLFTWFHLSIRPLSLSLSQFTLMPSHKVAVRAHLNISSIIIYSHATLIRVKSTEWSIVWCTIGRWNYWRKANVAVRVCSSSKRIFLLCNSASHKGTNKVFLLSSSSSSGRNFHSFSVAIDEALRLFVIDRWLCSTQSTPEDSEFNSFVSNDAPAWPASKSWIRS